MKYFLDTEFIEGFRRVNDKPMHFIELISIGIVCEDGRELYLINDDFNSTYANDFVKEHVLSPMFEEHGIGKWSPNDSIHDFLRMVQQLKEKHGKNMYYIRKKIHDFVGTEDKDVSFYGYYSDYDWVVFCSIFGTMMDLPKNFPMFCMDLKQMMQERGLNKEWKQQCCPDPVGEHNALVDAKWNLKLHEAIIKNDRANRFKL
jgi:hypothetical protein